MAEKHRLDEQTIAMRAAAEFQDGMVVNLGGGIPTLACNFVPEGREVLFHAENGALGYGGIATTEMADWDLFNASFQPVTPMPGMSFFQHDESFALIRGGHVDMTVLGRERFARDLARARNLLAGLTGVLPIGFRGPNLVFAPWATAVLEDLGFLYDSTVCASRSIGGKYKGWANAPTHPYHPSYDAIARPGDARLVELPIPSFPVLKLAAGSGIMTRVIGFHWTMTALRHAIRKGDTVFYFHPWEVGPRPRPHGHRLRNAVFLRHTGAWMMNAVERLLRHFHERIVPASTVAEAFVGTAHAKSRGAHPPSAARARGA